MFLDQSGQPAFSSLYHVSHRSLFAPLAHEAFGGAHISLSRLQLWTSTPSHRGMRTQAQLHNSLYHSNYARPSGTRRWHPTISAQFRSAISRAAHAQCHPRSACAPHQNRHPLNLLMRLEHPAGGGKAYCCRSYWMHTGVVASSSTSKELHTRARTLVSTRVWARPCQSLLP